MKIRMPAFQPFEDIKLDNEGFPSFTSISHPFFDGLIAVDADYNMYGFIGTSRYYDDAIVVSDDITLEFFDDGRPKKSSVKKTYNTIVKQLKERYRQWFIENMVD